MTIREKIVSNAKSDIGITENPPGSNICKFTDWAGLVGAWCGMAVSHWYCEAGWGIDPIDFSGGFWSVPNMLKWAKTHNKIIDRHVTNPKPGDIIIYMWKGKPAHTGIFVSEVDEFHFLAIEGNTSFDDKGSQSNGGAVALKRRTYSEAVFINIID